MARVKVPGCERRKTDESSRMRPMPKGFGEARWYRGKCRFALTVKAVRAFYMF